MTAICGIYKITSPSGRIYIGQSINVHSRKRYYTNHGCNRQPRLKHSFAKYGFSQHIFEIIEECNVKELNNQERHWQDFYDATGKMGLNCQLTTSLTMSGGHSIETKRKVSKANKGRKLSDKTKAKMSIAFKIENRKNPDEYRKNISDGLKAINWKPSRKCVLTAQKAHKGKAVSDETKAKISKTLKGRIRSDAEIFASSARSIALIIDDIEYANGRIAEKAIGISRTEISRRCKKDKWPNYQYKSAIQTSA